MVTPALSGCAAIIASWVDTPAVQVADRQAALDALAGCYALRSADVATSYLPSIMRLEKATVLDVAPADFGHECFGKTDGQRLAVSVRNGAPLGGCPSWSWEPLEDGQLRVVSNFSATGADAVLTPNARGLHGRVRSYSDFGCLLLCPFPELNEEVAYERVSDERCAYF